MIPSHLLYEELNVGPSKSQNISFFKGIPLNFVFTVIKRLNSQIRSVIKFV